ncbi:hypothetical protein [Actinokineospora globicatena]|uniref:Caspase domain-containing protein n=1 Tax=Actinokineospora globicatena TaxID=103729 RepID=A0A9W6VCN9_9PSEU|nr:hypothetical protein [Actinokineospora globicatena]GLW95164.1 hypothetical protein Aglo03_59800 [Actinokineospora globicatena]
MAEHLPDPNRSRAVVIGVGGYTTLSPLPSATASLDNLCAVLTSPDGVGLAHCTVLADPASAADVVRALDQAASEAEDLLLVYCAGRVLSEEGGAPHLATTATDSRYLATTALPLAEIRRILRRSQASRRVVLLDCAPGHAVGDSLDVEGVFVLCAPDHTPALLAALRDGIAGEGSVLTLSALARATGASRVHDGGLGAEVISLNPVDRVQAVLARLADTEHLLGLLAAEHTKTLGGLAEVRTKISSADRLGADVFDAPAAAVRDLRDAAAAGHWSAVAERVDAVDAMINAASESLAVTRARATGLLERRDELRGRLGVYLAMAVRVGLAEDPELAAAHRDAHRLLWTAPCDLAEATVAVTTYQNAVIRRRG